MVTILGIHHCEIHLKHYDKDINLFYQNEL